MKVSLNWAQHFSNVDLRSIDTQDLLQKIGAQLGAVEDVENWGERFAGVLVVHVVRCEKHPNADKLNVCLIDDGGVASDVTRNAEGLVEVVCGAPNVAAGQLVAWIPPGATVPSTFGKDPFVLEARELRGVVSNGMLASASELGLSDDHSGLLIIDPKEIGEQLARPGTAFRELYGLDDVVIDLENKMFTHRPDCFGILGVARELAGITGQQFQSPQWYTRAAMQATSGSLPLVSKNEIPEKVPRFTAQVVEGIRIMPSPVWMQAGFVRVGLRPINNIVDWTNYYMHLTAQPTHAFDYDKVKALCETEVTIFPRTAHAGEKLTLLGGKTVELTTDDIVIATDKQAIALAGVMGGADTEVDENTKNIIIECATFDMYSIRRTSMRHGIFTDAVARFNKGQSPLQNDAVLSKLVADIVEQTGAHAGASFDSLPSARTQALGEISTSVGFINDRLGSTLSGEDILKLLGYVEVPLRVQEDQLTFTVPFWRTDLTCPEDIVEEVGRLHGFDSLPITLPARSARAVAYDPLLGIKSMIREILSRAGANEVLTYSFVHGDLMRAANQNPEETFHIRNAISPDLQYYRMSLTPSLLEKVYANHRGGYGAFALFEMNRVHAKDFIDDEKLPAEDHRLSLVFSADDKTAARAYAGASFYQALRYATYVLDELGVDFVTEPAHDYVPKVAIGRAAIAPFDKERSVIIRSQDGTLIGELGEYSAQTRTSLKVPRFSAGFEFDTAALARLQNKTSRYQAISRYPSVEQDMSLRVSADTPFATVYRAVHDHIAEKIDVSEQFWLSTLDIFQRPEAPTIKQITLRMKISSYDRTLMADYVNTLLDDAAQAAKIACGAERI